MISADQALILSFDDVRLILSALQAGDDDWQATWTRVANRAALRPLAAVEVAEKLKAWVELKDREFYGSVERNRP